jgi:hypothetical protein
MAVVNLTLFFQTYARRFQNEFRKLVRTKTGIDGRKYSALKDPRKGRSKNSRLNDTGKFRDNYITAQNDATSLTISANKAAYDSGVSYADIVNYNNRDSGYTNRFIDSPPLIFPNIPSDLQHGVMKPLLEKFETDMIKAVEIQLGQIIPKQKTIEIRVL